MKIKFDVTNKNKMGDILTHWFNLVLEQKRQNLEIHLLRLGDVYDKRRKRKNHK